jgi:C4-type Zn-finger protein
MAKMVRIEPRSCPCCDSMLDAIEPIDGAPEFGTVPVNITICDCCGHLMLVEYDLRLREPTPQELRELTNHPTVLAERRKSVN